LQPYWVLSEGAPALVEPEPTPQEDTAPVGFIHKEGGNWRAEYSLYVPEYYTPQQRWPLIVCLHGGFGHGNEYIWTWLRPAKSKGYLLLSPKSLGPTWSVLTPALDIRSIQAMLDDVLTTYAVDRTRIYLTGLSDGGIFTYILGIARPELFTGIAPVAGQMHVMVDTLLRQGRGKELPIFVVHGAQDYIFPVAFTRQTCNLLTRLGYNVTYEELPDWGHAYTYTINERLVLPWFERVSARSEQAAK
jgi:phospholipase/carboxylesterase